jgi:drug/metabolite transporter (DMT)-like permease
VHEHLGQLYALGTAGCWVGTALFFTAAGQRIGSLVVNFIRLIMAIGILAAVQAVRGMPLVPTDLPGHAWLWLSVSGLVGFTFGDLCLFRAFVTLGPRLSALIMSLAPLFAALLGWLMLGEVLGTLDVLGMALTIGGVAWAVSDRTAPADPTVPRPTVTAAGILLAVGGALGQGGGLVLSKFGMGDHDAFAANQIRVLAGTAGFAVIFSATRWWPRVRVGLGDRTGLLYTAGGAFFGPFLGVSLSLLAVQHTDAGIAASIMAISPVLIIPVVIVFRGERVGIRGFLGALVAVAGVALLFQ